MTRRDGACQHKAVAVLVLQPFARQRRAAGGAAHQEALSARVGKRPHHVSDTLETEHRVIGEKRNRNDVVIRVRGSGCRERSHRTCLCDTLLEDLTALLLAVVQQHFLVVRFVELALAGINAHLPDDRLHAEGAAFVRNDRHDRLADLRVFQQLSQHADVIPWSSKPAAPSILPAIRKTLRVGGAFEMVSSWAHATA